VVLFLLASCRRPALPEQAPVDGDAGGGIDSSGAEAIPDSGPDGRPDAGAADGATDAIADAAPDAAGCLSNDECHPSREFCRKSSCAADARGACATRPGTRDTGFCTPPGDLVCGCDGNTYAYDCLANAAGMNIASRGACPLPDAGGAPCTTNDVCAAMGRYYCNRAACDDPQGTCQPRPEFVACQVEAAHPVCGCDHLNYGSPCGAASYGTSIAADGRCAP